MKPTQFLSDDDAELVNQRRRYEVYRRLPWGLRLLTVIQAKGRREARREARRIVGAFYGPLVVREAPDDASEADGRCPFCRARVLDGRHVQTCYLNPSRVSDSSDRGGDL